MVYYILFLRCIFSAFWIFIKNLDLGLIVTFLVIKQVSGKKHNLIIESNNLSHRKESKFFEIGSFNLFYGTF